MSTATPSRWGVNWSEIWDRIAAAAPGRVAVLAGGAVTTFGELEDRAARLAAAFAERGIGKGTPIGLFLYNRPEYLESIYAAFKLGAIPVNLNFRYRSRELAQLLEASGSRLVVYPSSLRDEVAPALSILDAAPHLVEVSDDGAEPADADGYERILGRRFEVPPGTRTGDDRIYMFTGGTTGAPKGVVWTHGDLLDAQLVSLYGALDVPLPGTVDEIVRYALDPPVTAPTTLPIAPLMHATAMFNTMNTLTLGGSVVFLNSPRFDPALTLREVGRQRVTRLIVAGNAVVIPLLDELDRAAAAGEPYDTSTLTSLVSSGMVWTDDVKGRLLGHLDALLFDILGASEGGPFAYSFVRSAADLPSMLRLAHGAVVLDPEGREVGPGGEGVLAYRGPMPLGYLGDAGAPIGTGDTYRTVGGVRYVAPGDWVRLHEDDRIEFLGRNSALVNTGGEKVYPAEVEEELLAHDDIVDAAVFGIPDPRWGAVVVAVTARRPEASVTEADLAAFLTGRLAGYKKPRRILVVDSLERSPSGKLDLRRWRSAVEAART